MSSDRARTKIEARVAAHAEAVHANPKGKHPNVDLVPRGKG